MTGSDITGIILAGGQGCRMGQGKAFLPWGPLTLIEHVIETLRPLVDELIVAAKDTRPFRHLNVRVIEDLMPDAHALGGLYTGLKAASHDLCFVCGCDAPFLNPSLIRFLAQQADGYALVIPKTRHGLQPLHAVYTTSALPTIKAQLHNQQWALQALVSKLSAKVVEPEAVHRFDPEELSFFNVNTPKDLAQALVIQQHLIESGGEGRDPGDRLGIPT